MMREQLPQGLENLIQSIGDMPIPENGEADISIKIRGNDVMERPMFAAGGGANKFPDLSGDGQITQKDILMGRGVIQKQAGGPIPDMPLPDMPMQARVEPPPEQMMQVQEVEQQADMEGEQVGLDYLARTMDGIDAAEDVEEMINAMRGNAMPIEARRMELAEFVGRDDAMATPETVLAMVQPTIMMSEEGAMNSGIGDLMRQMTEDVDMATEGGAPTDMGEGLGGLMMAGAPMAQEPVQGFAQGGAVKKFYNGGEVAYLADGGDSTLASLIAGMAPADPRGFQTIYDEYLPLYQNLISASDEDRKKDTGLALAKAGFQLASGRGPKGENIAGQPFLSQVGAAGQTLLEDIGDIKSKEREQNLAVKTLALKSAFDTAAVEKAASADFSTTIGKAALEAAMKDPQKPFAIGQEETILGNTLNRYGRYVNGVIVPLSLDETQALGFSTVSPTGQVLTKSDQIPLGKDSDQSARIVNLYLPQYAAGELTGDALRSFESQIENAYPFKTDEGQVVFEKSLPSSLIEAITLRLATDSEATPKPTNLRPEILNEATSVALEMTERDPTFLGGMLALAQEDVGTQKTLKERGVLPDEKSLDEQAAEVASLIGDVDITKGVGAFNNLARQLGSIADSAVNIITLGSVDPQLATERKAAFRALNMLAVVNLNLLLEANPGKENVQLQENLKKLLFDVEQAPFESPSAALVAYQQAQAYNSQVKDLLQARIDSGDSSFAEEKEAKDALLKMKKIGSDIDLIVRQFEGGPGGSGANTDIDLSNPAFYE